MELSEEIRQYLEIAVELLKTIVWPFIVIILLLRFQDVIRNAFSRSKETFIKIGGAEFKLTAGEAADALSDVFNEIDSILESHLTREEKKLFLKIISVPKTLAVQDLFSGFRRDTDEHKMLRALRGVYFIRPVEGGTWKTDKHIEVTNLGRLVARHKRDVLTKGIEEPSAVPAQQAVPPDSLRGR
jgi:hypothetical protein